MRLRLVVLALVVAVLVAEAVVFTTDAPEAVRSEPDLSAESAEFAAAFAQARTRAEASGTVDDRLAVAEVLLAAGRLREALADLDRLVPEAGTDPRILLARALALDGLGYIDEAAQVYRQVQGRAGLLFDPLVRHRLGEIALIHGDVASAEVFFRANRGHGPSHLRLARLCLHQGDRAGALDEVEAIRADPDLSQAGELIAINDLARRLGGEALMDLGDLPRDGLLSYQPIDILRARFEEGSGLRAQGGLEERIASPKPDLPGDADLLSALVDPTAIARGAALWESGACRACHGGEGFGGLGPNLRDAYWLGEAKPSAIARTIAEGRPGSAMAGHASLLRADQIGDLTVYLLDLHRRTPRDAEGRTTGGQPPAGTRQDLMLPSP